MARDTASSTDEGTYREQALEPSLPIIDAHHHLWSEAGADHERYATSELLEDLRAGHNVVGTVFVDCSSHYRTSGPPHLAPAGETEWVMSQRAEGGVALGIVSFADMYLGARAREVLEAHLAAGAGAFKGIRHSVAWDPSPEVNNAARNAPQHALLDPTFQAGVAELRRAGLVFETWCYFHQLGEVAALAAAFDDLVIVLDHLGGPVVIGPYSGRRDEMLQSWRAGLRELARRDNVYLKLGGIGYRSFVEPQVLAGPRSSEWLARYWGNELLFCVETFGPSRCMFESNFPVDRPLCDYVSLWNTFKLAVSELGHADRLDLFGGTARRAYRLDQDLK